MSPSTLYIYIYIYIYIAKSSDSHNKAKWRFHLKLQRVESLTGAAVVTGGDLLSLCLITVARFCALSEHFCHQRTTCCGPARARDSSCVILGMSAFHLSTKLEFHSAGLNRAWATDSSCFFAQYLYRKCARAHTPTQDVLKRHVLGT